MSPEERSSGARRQGRRLISVFKLHYLKEAPICAVILSLHNDWDKNKRLRAKSLQPDSKVTSPLIFFTICCHNFEVFTTHCYNLIFCLQFTVTIFNLLKLSNKLNFFTICCHNFEVFTTHCYKYFLKQFAVTILNLFES